MFRCQTAFAPSLIVAFGLTSAAVAQDQADLAKAAQNPVAAMISLPFQNNTLFEVGPDDDVANVLNIQPVIPFTLGDWNIINRTIVPVIYLPDVDLDRRGTQLPRGAAPLWHGRRVLRTRPGSRTSSSRSSRPRPLRRSGWPAARS
jgi:hypothetical protein